MSSGSQMPGKGIITGYNDGTDRLGARYLAVNHGPPCVGNTAGRILLTVKVYLPICCIVQIGGWNFEARAAAPRLLSKPEERRFMKLRRLWVEPYVLWRDFFVSLLWKKKGEKKQQQSNVCVKTLVLCFWAHLPTAPRARVLHCTARAPRTTRQRNFPHSLTHSRPPTSPSSERRTCIYSKPIFTTILTHMHCALDELWLAIITPPLHSACEKCFFLHRFPLLFPSDTVVSLSSNKETVQNVPGAQHPDVRWVRLASHLCVFHVKPFECRAGERTAYGRGLHFWTFAHPVGACVLFMTKMLWALWELKQTKKKL